jgi:hypothetical protein
MGTDEVLCSKPKNLIPKVIIFACLRLRKSGTPGESRTPNLLIRSQALYPIELRVQITKVSKIANPLIGASEFRYQPAKKPD